MYESVQENIAYNNEGEIDPFIVRWSADAKKEWIRIFDKITDKQNSENENEYMKSMLPKQKTYIPRFALLLNTLHAFDNEEQSNALISKDAILNAEKLSDYFILMAQKIKIDSAETRHANEVAALNKNGDSYESFVAIYKSSPLISTSKLAETLDVSQRTIRRYIKKYNA